MKIGFAATNGQFPSDYDIARAIVQMWKRVGIEANLRSHRIRQIFRAQPRGTNCPRRRSTAGTTRPAIRRFIPAICSIQSCRSQPWKGEEIGQKVLKLFNVADYDARIAGYRELNRFAVEDGATIPLLQSVLTVVHKKNLAYTKYANGWMLAQTLQWS